MCSIFHNITQLNANIEGLEENDLMEEETQSDETESQEDLINNSGLSRTNSLLSFFE